MTSGKY